MENTIEIIFCSTLPTNDDGFALAIQKLRENILFYIPNVFWKKS